ncbi:ferric-chelate reductase [Cryptococcus gattii EJB2]|uniref:ferric-chelate reductase (NADPH) n=1 Tax=Cryptococcus gattii EJB2 TaxID=1296103 RepID=A0ABR5BXQ0_9TREE|nr:ferric-chelate reductase [Cryptococcus gattii EJB2]
MTMCLIDDCPTSAQREAASANADSWYKAMHWASTTAIGCLILIGLLTIFNWSRRYFRYRPRKLTAALRGLGYPHLAFIDLSLGITLGLLTLFMSLFIWCFQMKPYYRPGVEWGNPPLGIRAGWIAQALVPFVFVMGSRINPLAWITRVEGSRWMIWHQYGARVLLFFSAIHTFVILYAPYRQGGISWTRAYWIMYNKPSNFFNSKGLMVNGTFALAALSWIVFSSFAKIRNWNYEFFIVQHILSILAFIISLWPHVKVSIPDSLYYVYASIAVWGFSILVRFVWETAEFAGLGQWKGRATLQGFGGDEISGKGGMTRLLIETNRGSWEVGQYVYLRVPSVNPFQSHPFTIASPPPTKGDTGVPSPLTILVSTRSGITKRIARSALSNPSKSIPVIVQGPFGGFGEKLERFDRVLVICGGVGAAMGWPVFSKLVREGRKVKMIWSVRRKGCLEWFNDDDGSFDRTNLIIHLTGLNTNQTSAFPAPHEEKCISNENENSKPLELEATTSTPSDEEKLFDTISESGVNFGRCNISKALREYAEELGVGERLAVLVCGPISMLADTANTVAKLQWDIVRGKNTLGEVWLHEERFGW